MGAEALEAAVFNWAQKRGVDLAELGIDIRTRRAGGRPHRLQVLLAERALHPPQDPGARTCARSPRSPTPSRPAGPACRATTCPAGCRTCWTRSGAGQPTRPARAAQVLPPARAPAARPRAGRSRPTSSPRRSRRRSTSTSGPCCSKDGGDVEIVDIKDTLVYCRLAGACAGLRRRRPDPADAGRADAEGHGRRTDPRRSRS